MSDYIEREAAITAVTGWGKCHSDAVLEYILHNVPKADVVEVKHGVWLYKKCVVFDCTKDLYRCSECKTSWDAESKYCPNCGAKMDGE